MALDNRDKAVFELGKRAFNEFPSGGKNDEGKEIRFAVYILLLLAVALLVTGTDFCKVSLRKKIGYNELSYPRIIISGLVFGSLAALCFIIPNDILLLSGEYFPVSEKSVFWAGLFHSFTALFILTKGINNLRDAEREIEVLENEGRTEEAKILSYYAGESIAFESLTKAGYNPIIARNWSDMLVFTAITTILCYFNPLIGIPYFVCIVSYYLVLVYEIFMGIEKKRNIAEKYVNAIQQTTQGDIGATVHVVS